MNSPVVTSAEMRAAEEAAFSRGITAEALMDEAAAGIARTVTRFFPQPGRCLVVTGKGNNAGDAFAAAALLHAGGWKVDLRLAFPESDLGELAAKKLGVLRRDGLPHVPNLKPTCTVILDGLLGLGAKPPLREPILSACREINEMRQTANAFVFAVDIPTGLDGDSGEVDDNCVRADFTVTIGATKRGLLADRALDFVGRLEVVELFDLRCASAERSEVVATATSLRGLLPRRSFNAHKNQFGRVGIVAGSRGLTGAAALCSSGALRAGAGLVELFVPEEIYPVLSSAAAPEVMVKPITSYKSLLEQPIDVWAAGPGLSQKNRADILPLIKGAKQPMVVDADGLNMLARDVRLLGDVAGPRLLTPHPGEMKRLDPEAEGTRAEIAQRFCDSYPVTLLLKGSRTVVAERKQPLSYNTTGNPGMATGGMGDVLTGVCAALIAQKLSPYDASRLGAWLCGRAAEIAIFEDQASDQSLLPTDVLANLGRAFKALQSPD